jgi:ubiquinone/menaquinone biosynthesis C-methylase UbiE
MDGAISALLEELYLGTERQGPGSEIATRNALRFVGSLGPEARIADIGCGTGAQTMVLAEELTGRIVAVDLLPGFLKALEEKIELAGLGDQVKTLQASMDKLPFKEAELDLIWSEGAVYNMGFSKGIQEWSRFLKPGGFLAVSELTWFSVVRPKEIEAYWSAQYPEIDTVSGKIAAIEKAGLVPTAHFALPNYCWTQNYYQSLEAREEVFLRSHKGESAAESIVAENRHERHLYEKYGEYYGYVFYVMRKRLPAVA